MRSLIVNADDLGWTEGVNRGIVECHRNGLVTSTSLLANGRAFASAAKLAKSNPELGIGVHLNLNDGPPTASPKDVPSLLDESGNLYGGPESHLLRLASRTLRPEEVEREWDAQIRKVRDAGIEPTHVDGHKHVQMLPGLFEVALKLAKKHDIGAIRVSRESSPLRTALSSGKEHKTTVVWKQGVQARGLKLLAVDARAAAERAGIVTTDYFCGIAQTGEFTPEGVGKFLTSLPDGVTEFMCHPGYADEELRASKTRLQESRQKELEILTNPEIRNLVARNGIRLINYSLLVHEA